MYDDGRTIRPSRVGVHNFTSRLQRRCRTNGGWWWGKFNLQLGDVFFSHIVSQSEYRSKTVAKMRPYRPLPFSSATGVTTAEACFSNVFETCRTLRERRPEAVENLEGRLSRWRRRFSRAWLTTYSGGFARSGRRAVVVRPRDAITAIRLTTGKVRGAFRRHET